MKKYIVTLTRISTGNQSLFICSTKAERDAVKRFWQKHVKSGLYRMSTSSTK